MTAETGLPPLLDAPGLAARLADSDLRVVDTRFDLRDPGRGRAAYLASHVPGAVYADLDRDLSGPPLTDAGRHPLPSPSALTATFARLGIGADTTVVAYDAAGGALAARLWWLLRYMGHERVALLDGGWPAWMAAGLARAAGDETPPAACFSGAARRDRLVLLDELGTVQTLVDCREPARYQGLEEPLDPVAGHIPGAVNHSFQGNLDEHGRFRRPDALRLEFERVLAGAPADDAVFYCGSGVTACHALFALSLAGLGDGRLYAGSWSEWCRDPERPVAAGPAP